MAPSGKKTESALKKEDIIVALLIADDFESGFGCLERDEPKILLPLVNVPIINYTLEFLHASGVQKVILFCSNHANKIKNYIKNSTWIQNLKNMTVSVTVSETCLSVGDAIRDVYDKRLISDDFVLIIGSVVSNILLKPLLQQHREMKKKDKSTVMTTLFSRHSLVNGEKNLKATTVAYLENSKQILFLQGLGSKSKVSIPLDVFLENTSVNICSDLHDCQINICSAEVLSLFADNFDYQTRNDFIKGLLVHEEVLGNTAYLSIIEEGYAACVNNLQSYRAVSQDILSRWVVPIAPEQMTNSKDDRYNLLRHNIYKHPDVISKDCQLINNVIIGKNSTLGPKSTVIRSVIGENCEIGSNVSLKDVYIWNNSKIDSNTKIESAIIAGKVGIGKDVEIYNCVLDQNVEIESKAKLENCFKSTENDDEDDFNDEVDTGLECNDVSDPFSLKPYLEDYSNDEDDEGEREGENCGRMSPELDDTKLFYRELRDTLIRGLEEKLSCDNLVLEINSLKYAYNVTVTEVNHLLTRAVLDISDVTNNPKEKLAYLKQLLKQFKGIFLNYLKSQSSQMEVLNSLKEYGIENKNFLATIANVIHFLYENEVLLEEVIISWHQDDLSDSEEIEKEIKLKTRPLVKWLEEAEEESE